MRRLVVTLVVGAQVYRCRVVLTNVSSAPQKVEVLLQIPQVRARSRKLEAAALP